MITIITIIVNGSRNLYKEKFDGSEKKFLS